MKIYLFADTETTGLPKNFNAPVTNLDNWPRLVEIGWVVTDETGKELSKARYIIMPDGFEIPKGASDIHGITQEIAMRDGVDLELVMDELASLILKADVIVAHNIGFDEKIIGAELLRLHIEHDMFETTRRCTMKESTSFCKCLPVRYGSYKWPNLQELHKKCFGVEFKDAHSALADIEATARCFWYLVKNEVIKL